MNTNIVRTEGGTNGHTRVLLVNACIVKRASKCFHAVDSTFTLWNLASYYKYFFTHHSMPGPEILKHILMRMRGDKGQRSKSTYVRTPGAFWFRLPIKTAPLAALAR